MCPEVRSKRGSCAFTGSCGPFDPNLTAAGSHGQCAAEGARLQCWLETLKWEEEGLEGEERDAGC